MFLANLVLRNSIKAIAPLSSSCSISFTPRNVVNPFPRANSQSPLFSCTRSYKCLLPPPKSQKKEFYQPASWKIERSKSILRLYKELLILSKKFQFDLYRNFLFANIRERFRYHKNQKYHKFIDFLVEEAYTVREKMKKCLLGDPIELKLLDDLAWGRTGRLKIMLDKIKQHPKRKTKVHKLIKDSRTMRSKRKWHQAIYAMPIDPRVYRPPFDQPPPPPKFPHSKKVFIVRTSFVRSFLRYQGRSQPRWLSVRLFNFRKKKQRELDLYNTYRYYLELAKHEALFVKLAGGGSDAEGFESFIEEIIAELTEKHRADHKKNEEWIKNTTALLKSQGFNV
ncbi:hypothetical protein DSO57_1035285 [Entomophthora muscae]|uniref:Uncharacterized protein n=1 Tax=Entomophthora muscae TaxID=34485 RepID=A0ACC2TLI7_9FUNG|nr:hypothetical protein DSO57_1035285 [Entomophthora muscae]